MTAKVCSSSGRTLKELPAWRSDVWLRDVCLVCQTKYCTAEEKTEHAFSETHLKRVTLYDFFLKESRSLKLANRPSVLLHRYKQSHALAIGLECIHEFVMPFCSTPWWACSICYKADASLDVLDDHLHSIPHIKTYIDEFHPGRVIDESLDRFTLIDKLYTMRLELLEEQGKLESPEVLNVEGATKEWAIQKLAIVENMNDLPYKIGELFGGHEALHCKVCHSTIASVEQKRERCWETHITSSYHQRMQMLASTISQFDSHRIDNPIDVHMNKWQQNASGTYVGPVAGLQYLLFFGSRPYCDLCYTVLDVDEAMEHFRCENHLIKFLSYHRPGAMYTAMYLPDEARRTQMLSIFGFLGNDNLGGLPRKIEAPCVPEVISANSNPNVLNAPSLMPPLLSVGCDDFCFWCPVCWRVLKVSGKEAERIALWTEHCTKSKKHFQAAVRRAQFNFEEENFVDIVTTLQLPAVKEEAVWKTAKLDGVEVEVQRQTDVGLDFLVDDLHNQEVVCVACAAIFPRSLVSQVSLHVRSMDHLMQYLHATDREMYNLVKSQKSSQVEHDLLMDYLRRSISSPGNIRVYNADLASTIARWGHVPYRKVELSAVEAELRPIYSLLAEIVDKVADDSVELITVPVKDALQLCSVRIHSISEKAVLLYCTGCERVFSAAEGSVVEGTWDGHLLGASHARRVASLAKNKLDSSGFIDEKPKFTATVVDQSDIKKRVVWRWKESANLFEYVYAVVGLGDMVERRSVGVGITHIPDIYCMLCAEVVPCSQEWLDCHVRSLAHVLNYVQKYYTDEVAQLETLQRESSEDGGRSLRKYIGLLLKDELGSTAQMRVYDPYGVQKQRETEALKVAAIEAEKDRQKEKIKKIAEQRKKEFEEQKQREAKLEEDRRRKAADERRLKLARLLAQRRYDREREERMKRREAIKKGEEGKKVREEEARKRQRATSVARQRVKDGNAKKQKEMEREERIAQLRREEQALAEAKRAELERQRAIQIHLEEQRIEEEMFRIREEKARIMQNLSTIQNHQERALDLNRLNVSVPNAGAPRLPVNMSDPVSQSSSVCSVSIAENVDSWKCTSSAYHPSDVPKRESSEVTYSTSQRSASVTKSHSQLAPRRVISPVVSVNHERGHSRKTEIHPKAFKQIETRESLVDYLWKQGGEAIPEAEMPQQFNNAAARKNGLLGLCSVYQVQCSDRPSFESYYCSACSVWTTASDMFNHLMTPEHRLGYLFRNYKMYHKSAMSQPNITVRDQMLEQFAQQIWKLEGSGEVRYRLSCAVNYETISRLWPQHIRLLNNDWMSDSVKRASTRTPPPGTEPGKGNETRKRSEAPKERERERGRGRPSSGSDKGKNKAKEREKIRQKEKDSSSKGKGRSPMRRKEVSLLTVERSQRSVSRRHSRSRSRHPARTRSPAIVRSRRSRSRSKSRDRHRSPLRIAKLLDSLQSMQGEAAWEDAAAAFLTKIGDRRGADRVRGRSPLSRARSRSRSGSRLKRSRSRISSSRRRSRSRSCRAQSYSRPSESSTRKREHERGSDEKKRKSAFDERVEQETAGGLLKVWEGLPEEVNKNLEKEKTVKGIPSDEDIDRMFARRAKMADQEKRRDPKEDMRKLLGLLVTMQQEAQQRGELDDATISRLYKEVGIAGGDLTSGGILLQQLCHMLAGDAQSSSSSVTQPYQQPEQPPRVDLERFGIAPAKEPTPASFVYPGAPTPTEQTSTANEEPVHLSYTSDYGGIKRTATTKGSEREDAVLISPWINGPPDGGPPLSLLTGAAGPSNLPGPSGYDGRPVSLLEQIRSQPSQVDIYAARRMKESAVTNENSEEQGVSSSWAGEGLPLSRVQDETGALSYSAGFPIKRRAVPTVPTRACTDMDENERNAGEEAAFFVEDRSKLIKKSVTDPRQKLLEARPDLSRWTGANNPANNTSLKAVIAGLGSSTSSSKQRTIQKPIDSWNMTSTAQRPSEKISQADSDHISQMETAVIGRQGSDTQKGPGNGQARQTRSERRAKRRAAFLASKTTSLAEVAQTAIEPVERVDDLEDSNNALWTENTDSSFGHTRGRNSFIEESTDGYSNTPGLIDSSVADVSHAFEGYTSQLVTSSSNSKTAYSTSRPSNASFVSNKSTFATINNAATWEDLGSTVSALFNNAKKQNTESDSASSFLKKKASAAVVSLDEPPPPPPPISLSSSKPTKTTPTQYDHVSSSAVVTQYSGQPTKYSQPITTRVYNPTLSNYSSLNASEPLYTSTIGAENVFATTTVNHSSYDSAQPSLYVGAMQPIFVGAQLPLYGGLQQSSGYTSTPVAQSSQTGCYYNSYYPSFPSYSHF